MIITFDSQDEQYKRPFGAVKAHERIHFAVVCSELCEVKLVMRSDSNTYNRKIRMERNEDAPERFVFTAEISLPEPDLYFYRFEVGTADGILFCGREGSCLITGDWLPEWQLTVYAADFSTPDWIKGGIMYQIFPDRLKRSEAFQLRPAVNERIIHNDWNEPPLSPIETSPYRANDYFCGNLDGIIEQLDHIAGLGVDAIYLNPIFESAENHRYSTGDYLKIDPYLGTNEAFERLTEECRKRGIRVILDGVFSHTGADSIYFNRYGHYNSLGAYNSADSPYYSWYRFNHYPDDYESWWGFQNLPATNELDDGFSDFIAGRENSVIGYWQEKGCGGWRLDVADELPDGFLDKLRGGVKALDPDALIIGEVWEDASNKSSYGARRRYLLGGQLDTVMNYPFRQAILDLVLGADGRLFKSRVMSILENYPRCAVDTLMNILSTHDTVRIITQLGVTRDIEREAWSGFKMTAEEYALARERLKLAGFLQFTLPGVPCIYYGDETGLQGFADPFNRMCYPYGTEDLELLVFYKELTGFRRINKVDFCGGMTFLQSENGVIVYRRGNVTCAVNLTENETAVETDGAGRLLFSSAEQALHGRTIIVSPRSFCAVG